jgi:inner membrane protein
MDNITHTLAGLLIGETISRVLPPGRSALAAPRRRGMLLAIAVVGSNLPDADLLYTIAAGHKLAYLSQHRGYTHTVLGALVAVLLVLLALEGWSRWRRAALTRADQSALLLTLGVSLLLHLALDFTNSYGVHPWWPLDDRWYYGDAVFIVEPLLWACAAPLLFLLHGRMARAAVGLVLAAALVLSFGTRWALPSSGIALALLMAALLFAGWRATPKIALGCAIGAWLAVTAVFAFASQRSAQRLEQDFAARHPRARLLDHVLTPMPANPLCWDAIAVSLEDGRYALRRAVVAAAPGLLPAAACPDRSLDDATTAPLRRTAHDETVGLRWLDEYEISAAEFAPVVQVYCDAAVLMRFARAPFLAPRAGGWTIGDLRFDREPGLGFAEIALAPAAHGCSTPLPPWSPPRRELLR